MNKNYQSENGFPRTEGFLRCWCQADCIRVLCSELVINISNWPLTHTVSDIDVVDDGAGEAIYLDGAIKPWFEHIQNM